MQSALVQALYQSCIWSPLFTRAAEACLHHLDAAPSHYALLLSVSTVQMCHFMCRYTIVNQEWVEQIDEDRVQQIKDRFLELHEVLSIQDFISGWFHGVQYETICRGNVLDFVAYGFYSKQPSDLTPKVGSQKVCSQHGCCSSADAGLLICAALPKLVQAHALPHSA